nr:MAG TPA: Replication initiation factor [Inoviridae sp.]
MIDDRTYETENRLQISCDWISFTLDKKEVIPCLELFGQDRNNYSFMEKGAQGYKKMLRHSHYAITVLFDGNEDMGVHIDVKGSAITYFLQCFRTKQQQPTPFKKEDFYYTDELLENFSPDNILPYLFQTILEHGHFTRLDVAIDDKCCRYFSVDDVAKILDNEDIYIAKFRSWRHIVEKSTSGEMLGNTIYMGTRKSDIMLRLYDKQLEQQKKEVAVTCPWVRWEFEIKKERADSFAKEVIHNQQFGVLGMQLLSWYLRFINQDDSNKSRCSTLPLWDEFINNVGKLKLSINKSEKSVEKSLMWVQRQCAPTIAGLVMANAGDISFLTDKLPEHYNRLSLADRSMFESYLKSNFCEGGAFAEGV